MFEALNSVSLRMNLYASVFAAAQAFRISSAPFSASIITGALRFAFGTAGMIEASMQRKPVTPRTLYRERERGGNFGTHT